MKKLCIIGGVAAGATAAARARRLDSEVEITVLEAGPDVSFANCGLPYYVGGDIAHRSSLILAGAETFYDQYRVIVHTNTEATAINRKKRIVTARNTDSGQVTHYPYDTLILTQGGKPVVPPIPGVEGEQVFQLWTLGDMDRIDRFIRTKNPQRALVVGGGFIGLEMVEALVKRGLTVTVVEAAAHVMPNLEAEFAGFLTQELQEYGVHLRTGCSVERIATDRVKLSEGTEVDADLVLLAVGVRPTGSLAREAGLEMSQAGGLIVNGNLQTSDEAIFAASDMVEITHSVAGKRMRIPLAGPANRQGRITAENALGGSRAYRGALGTSIVKLFDAVAGSTGLSLTAAREAGFSAEAVVVHKTNHTAYYPGAERVSLILIFERSSGRILGAQAAGREGVDKRLDVVATAIAGKLTISDLAELDLAYAPPFNSPNGPVNMAAFTAMNHSDGFSPAVLARDVEQFALKHRPVVVDLRDPISFGRAHLNGSTNLSHNLLRENMDRISSDETVLLISEDGQKGHVALRMLRGAGFSKVFNLSGGYISLERHARARGFEHLQVGLLPLEKKTVTLESGQKQLPAKSRAEAVENSASAGDGGEQKDGGAQSSRAEGPLVVDVRTPMEHSMGACPGSLNIPLDELGDRLSELGDKSREIILYCASGARSAYGVRMLQQLGYASVRNGGSLHDMLALGL